MRSISRAATFMRFASACAPSMAAKVCPQQAWFLKVMRQMLKVLPSPSSAFCQSGPSLMARPKPASPSMTSSPPITPSRAASAAVTPASAARPACSGLDIESMRNDCCRAAENVATVASACAKRFASSCSSSAAAAAAPNTPMVPVLCQYL